ncbi:tetratricopeptide repeat protein [Leptothermofonsia sp. ETS-13]|uniref:tetratricopeptide repeat protein n=1 Tax=Leptothermofonsia sp. ETS-13 TaxID=3035696 RepID=UPI003BA05407
MTTEKRNRWMINVVLILAVISFIGFSIIPLIEGALTASQTPKASPSPSQTASSIPNREQLQKQAEGYELVLQREPDNQTALRGLLEARLGMGDVKGSIAPLEKLVKLNPNQTDYAILLAQAKQQLNDLEGAAQTYRDILKVKQGNIKALDGLTTLLLQQKRPEAAIGLLQDTLKTAPKANQIEAGSVDVPSVQLLLGRVYAEQKRYDEAIAMYDEAAKSDENDFRPVLAKAIVLKAQGKTDEAKPLFNSAANLAPAQYKDQINELASSSTSITTTPPSTAPTPTSVPASP